MQANCEIQLNKTHVVITANALSSGTADIYADQQIHADRIAERMATLQINLGMALVRAGNCCEAVALLKQLDAEQCLNDKPAALLAFGQALAITGDKIDSQSILSTALAAHPDPTVRNSIIVVSFTVSIHVLLMPNIHNSH